MCMANTTGPGMSLAPINVGLVQVGPATVPVPSVSVEPHATANPPFPKSLICGMPVQNSTSMGMMTSGCVGPGATTGTMLGPGCNVVPSTCVFYGGAPATTMMSPTLQNLTNASGVNMGPDQVIVAILR